MSNRATHCFAGVSAGAVAAGCYADRQTVFNFLFEIAGGCAGGYLGARVPDWIDPATNPNHRNWGHGGGTVAGGIYLAHDTLLSWQRWLRTEACRYERMAEYAASDLAKLGYLMRASFLRAAAGMIAGFVAGYVSHVALDFTTPMCIPLVAREF